MSTNLILAEPILDETWITSSHLAAILGCTREWIRKRIKSGYLVRKGYIVYQDHRKRWWIKPPINII